ncbi:MULTISPECIES: ABC transporter permease [unclassified Microbacterium]|uniref:ABC transporter permease n=1 Tax=unclassified Microbacterium TaxID=2609290 RepID=UPI00214C4B2A|nr:MULTISPECIES: ABC transporter permease [unclassified Microbacterium]MCR2785143.1 ABC transporter permease [Microbacterium sp. zg.B96]MDL5352504.1 ABC transporter permease [Microbacterium sp. zg-YB36]WIM16676.1 ABC transporter permease [Microbacterium sp. zg-B96]
MTHPRDATSPQPGAASPAHPSPDELRAEAMAWGRKPRTRGSWYVTEHMVRAMRAYGWTIVVGALGQPIIYLLGLGVGLAALIQAPVDDAGVQVSYLLFVAPALLMTAAIAVASEEFTYPVMAGFKWRRYFYGFNASPLSPAQIANGVIVGASARMLVGVAAYYGFIWIFFAAFGGGVPHPATAWLSIVLGVLAGVAFGIPLMAYAASIEDDKGQFALVQRFIFMPMFLFSGTFYPLSNLPDWLEWIGWVSPLWHATQAGRILTYGAPEQLPAVLGHTAYLLVLAAIGYALARGIFERRLAK